MLSKITSLSLLFIFCFFFYGYSAASSSRGLQVQLKNTAGVEESVALYKGSYALLIGVSEYHAGWPMLPSIPGEIHEVEILLQEKGFHVETILNPDGIQLEAGFRSFVNTYGLDKENRLLFFFSGHGHTRGAGKKGYLVPVDAPDPEKNLTGFLQKSLGMNQVLSWARDIEAKHALFLFDSCFSGTIFTQKAGITPPPHITRLTIEPVRQFITAGGADDEVPAKSTFTPTFINGLRHGLADFNNDGYVSATELGLYLQTELPDKADQNPQYGKIRDYDLARGDFIFTSGEQTTNTTTPASLADKQTLSAENSILRVGSSPEGAAVFIDNTFQGSTPLLLNNIEPGTYNIRAEKTGYLSETKFIEISATKQVSIAFELIALAAEGSLHVKTNPAGATISILDYQGIYTEGMKLPAGNYSIKATKYGFISEVAQIQIRENEDIHLNITLQRDVSIAAPDNQEIENQSTYSSTAPRIKETAVPSKPVAIEPEKKKIVHTKKPSLPPEIRKYIANLKSRDSGVKRNTAKIIYRKRVHHPAVLAAVEVELIQGATRNLKNKHHIDAMAWLCNILGSTQNSHFKQTLNTVAKSQTHRKIKKYAIKNMRKIP